MMIECNATVWMMADSNVYQRAPGRYTFYRSNGYLSVRLV